MSSEAVGNQRRHNPVDSICRKIQTIQRRDQEANPTLQIPKFQSRNYDSPQSNLKKNLEGMLKNRTVKNEKDLLSFGSPAGESLVFQAIPGSSPCKQWSSIAPTPSNATYTISSLTAEKNSKPWPPRSWSQSCSTPSTQTGENYFDFAQYSAYSNAEYRSRFCDKTDSITASPVSYNINLCTPTQRLEGDKSRALVVKRLSMGEGGASRHPAEKRADSYAEVSLICEEDLLDTIFHACDTQRRGKVSVSRIVDYLRHTTSRGSEDSGLEELCNMLDPERRDISIDLPTYHAIMKEWIDDCRNNGDEGAARDATQGSSQIIRESLLSGRRSALLNVTVGSLEAFGGEVSRGDFLHGNRETSDLVYCVADLQFNNQKLLDQMRKLKLAVEVMEETNNKLLEEKEDFRAQAKSGQQSDMKVKVLQEELEEMKVNLNSVEENRVRMVAQNKQMERDNLSLILKISSLQEENIRNTMDIDGLQKKIADLCNINANLQMQMHSFESVVCKNKALLLEKNIHIQELNSTIAEYSSIMELLRNEKNKLENHINMMQPDLASGGMSLSLAYRLNQSIAGSLHTELALAQQSPEATCRERMSPSLCHASSLDETLDREVLLLLQGPLPEQMSAEFKTIIQKMRQDFTEDANTIVASLKQVTESQIGNKATGKTRLEALERQLEEKRSFWIENLQQLDQHKSSLENELIKMASNLRRSRTEIIHLKKDLSSRLQELEAQKQLQEEAVRKQCEVASQTEPSEEQQVTDETTAPDTVWNEVDSLRCQLEETVCEKQKLQDNISSLSVSYQGLQQKIDEQQTTVHSLREKLFKGQCCGLLCQQEHRCQKGFRAGEAALNGSRTTLCISMIKGASCWYTPLIDALTLELLQLDPRLQTQKLKRPSVKLQECKPIVLKRTAGTQVLLSNRCEVSSVGVQGEEDLSVTSMSEVKETAADQSSVSAVPLKSDNHEKAPVQDPAPIAPGRPEMTGRESQEETGQGERSPKTTTGKPKEGNESVSLNKSLSVDPSPNDGSLSANEPKNETLTPRSKFKMNLELSKGMEAIDEHKGQEPPSNSTTDTVKANADNENEEAKKISTPKKEDKNILSPNDKEIEAEFQRLSLGFKCDAFTLDKRLRLEERSRDLAEGNLKKELNNCNMLLETLIPLCAGDNQSLEVVQRLQKNLDILNQSMTRVSTRAELVGAIHQESSVCKAVEVMIQHVENLKRLYTKEHTELEELKVSSLQNERSFGFNLDKDDLRNKRSPGSQYYKPSSQRRVSIAAIPRNNGGPVHFDLQKLHANAETEANDKLSRRSSTWTLLGVKPNPRPALQRFISSCTWAESDEPSLMKGHEHETESPPTEEKKEEIQERKPSLSEKRNIISAVSITSTIYNKISSYIADFQSSLSKTNKRLWISLIMVILFAAVIGLIAGFAFQPSAEAAPVGTGDSWMSIQQLLWPYTGLRHNGQPPV
ncbi:inositol 1,4,5-triphosphate receptor associated 2 isoform X1 [Acipenser ruthenus]|uniref:inositol 1,4,5-triphosphate receptor associated 2 isoform X1 n=1 Tax=Acipenser ruthenus TaxID=7906 RepID=UPI002740CD72|nr:inositol 1,4,5-triphosphate receptor associated 2 isoform X1 [Acipenser ruthenus]